MILLVTGGRNNRNVELHERYLDKVAEGNHISLVVHGACGQTKGKDGKVRGKMKGTDGIADAWARKRGFPVLPCPAEWDEFGKAAGRIRNQQMGDIVCDHHDSVKLCVAFPGGPGTSSMVSVCEHKAWNIPVWQPPGPFPSLYRASKQERLFTVEKFK